MNNKVALFDMDDVLADYAGQLSRDLAKLGVDMKPGYWWTHRVDDSTWNMITLIKSQKGWWENLPPIKSGLNLINLCADIGFQIGILTRASKISSAWEEKFKWFENHVMPIYANSDLFVVTGNKSLVYGRVFVDDSPEYMNSWLEVRPRGLGIMPSYYYNNRYKHPRVLKYDSKSLSSNSEIEIALRKVYERKAGREI
jgi:5'-nucleotidase